MKKLFALAALVLGLASCQKDTAGLDVIVDGEQETTISVSLPEVTRANSALGAVDNEVLKEYDLRYILEIYDGANRIKRMVNVEDNSTSTAFDVRLIPGYPYTFVAWADFVENGSEEDNYYNTANGLTAVTANFDDNGKWIAMTEARDAYTGKHYEESYSSTSNITLKLKRPFAKLRVVTNDMDVLNMQGKYPKSVSVAYNDVYTGFNAFAQTVCGNVEDVTASYNIKNAENKTAYDETGSTLTLLADYLFGAENGTIQFTMNTTIEADHVITTNFNTDIPLEVNKVTTIKGNVLTEGNDIEVIIDERFDGNIDFDVEEDTITTTVNINTSAELVAALQTAVAAGETNIVFDAKGANIGNFNKDDNTWFTTNLVPTGVTVTLRNATVSGISRWNNANGTLIFENCTFTNNSAYSINFGWGNGHVKFTNCKLYGWCSFSGVTVEMNDCNIAGNGSYALVRSYNTFTMNNCTIDGSNAIKDDDYPDGVSIGDGAVLTMTGCTMTDAEYDYGESLIDGNRVVDYGENSSYIIVDGKRLVCNPSSLEYALKNGNAILMENNITVEAHLTNTSHGTNINIDGGGNELTLRGIYGVSGANVSLSNMTLVDSKTDDYTIFNQGGKIELNNVTYNSTINKAFQMAGGGDVVLTDCNISGDVTGTYSASNIWCGDGRNVTVNGGTYGSIFMNAQYHSGWPAASAHAASKITLNDGTITKLMLETELGAEGYYVSATLTQNGGTITNLVENPQNLDLTGRSQYNK